jgi:hypothetical protein
MLSELKNPCTTDRAFYAKGDSQIIKYQQLMPALFHT